MGEFRMVEKMVKRKIVQVKIIGPCASEDIMKLKNQLFSLDLPDYDFIITSEKIELTDIKHLIKHLFELYKKYKKEEINLFFIVILEYIVSLCLLIFKYYLL